MFLLFTFVSDKQTTKANVEFISTHFVCCGRHDFNSVRKIVKSELKCLFKLFLSDNFFHIWMILIVKQFRKTLMATWRRVKTCFFVTVNIKSCFSWKFYWNSWSRSEDMKNFFFNALFLFYKHTTKLSWSSICLRFSQFEPEIILDGMLNFKAYFMVWYCVWYNTAMVSFECSNVNIQLSLSWTLQWSL